MRSYHYNMFNIGDIVKSKKGHDAKRYYIVIKNNIVEAGSSYVLLSDGWIKKLENLKKKNIKHLLLVESNSELAEKISKKDISNKEISDVIKTLIGGINV